MQSEMDKGRVGGLEKTTEEHWDPFAGLLFTVGVAENKNVTYRATMEDVHTYVANFAEQVDWGYFAIFDGHAGKKAARWCGNNLHTLLEKEILDEKLLLRSVDLQESLCNAFTKADDLILKESAGNSGCTAAVAVLRWEEVKKEDRNEQKEGQNYGKEDKVGTKDDDISYKEVTHGDEVSQKRIKELEMLRNLSETPGDAKSDHNPNQPGTPTKSDPTSISQTPTHTKNKPIKSSADKNFDFVPSHHKRMLYTLNVGDLRIILLRKNRPHRLLYDHKATDENEINRIHDRGGLVMKNRVNGVLAVTRSLGDSYMKDLVIGHPYTTATELNEDDEFMILACDGLWDVVLDTKAVQTVHQAFESNQTVTQAAKKLCLLAMDLSTTDNVTIMVVRFDRGVFELGEAVGKMTV